MQRPQRLTLSSLIALAVIFGSLDHSGYPAFSFGGDPAKAAAGGNGNGGGGGGGGGGNGGGGGSGGGGGGGGNGGGGNGGGGGGGGGGGNGGGGNGNGNGNAGGNGNGNAGGNGNGNNGDGGGNTAKLGATALPPSQLTNTPKVSGGGSVVVKMKAYRAAVLENDLEAAASALASVKTEITASEIEQINEILGLNSETTSLSTGDIYRGVREVANAQN